MKPLLALLAALLLGGCRASTIAAAGMGIAQGLSGEPPPPKPPVVRVEVESRPSYCYFTTIGNHTAMHCI
jgi:hypothetical protein